MGCVETMLLLLRHLTLAGLLATAMPAYAADGKALFATCAACHGARGEGNAKLGASNIAGMSSWYLSRQLTNFASGIRGANKSDAYGKQMRDAAKVLVSDGQRMAVAEHIAAMPSIAASSGRSGAAADATRLANGRNQFNAICSSCHGSGGRGNQTLGAPNLAGLDAAYAERQLLAFREGTRGAHPDDKWGAQMRVGAAMLPNAASVRDVAVYMTTLK